MNGGNSPDYTGIRQSRHIFGIWLCNSMMMYQLNDDTISISINNQHQ
jgi:hypothetical protein